MQVGECIEPDSRGAWRAWLAQHYAARSDIWLLLRKKSAGPAPLTLAEAIEEALCFGWVDSQTRSVDDARYAIRFSPRRPKSNWTPGNREKARRLFAEGRMTGAGIRALPADLRAELGR